jgi:hypothetical protein
MKNVGISRKLILLGVGDILAIALVTAAGFASHGELGNAGTRMLATFLPLVIAWFMSAPFLGAYDLARAGQARQLWRPFWAMLLAGPLAAWGRGVILGAPILPVFVFVLTGVSAVGMLAWRALYLLLFTPRK